MIEIEAVKIGKRRKNKEINGGEGHRTMEENLMRSATEMQKDKNGGGKDARYGTTGKAATEIQ